MSKQPVISPSRFDTQSAWRSRLLPAMLGIVALASSVAGIGLLFLYSGDSSRGHFVAPAAIVLVLCSCLQWRTTWRVWRQVEVARQAKALFGLIFWRRMFLGAFLMYVVAVCIGPARHIEYGLLAAVTAWYTLLLFFITVSPSAQKRWQEWSAGRGLRRLGTPLLGLVVMVIALESGLQAYKYFGQAGSSFGLAGLAPAEQNSQAVLAAMRRGENDRVARLVAGPLRVGVLLDEPVADRRPSSGYLSHVEQALPGVRVVPITLESPWTSKPSEEIARRLSTENVDVALAMLPVCEDLAREAPQTSWFDWRQFELTQMFGVDATTALAPPAPQAAGDFESFCRLLAPQLVACRTPIDDNMHQRWERTFAAVDNVAAVCRSSNVTLVLVLVPGEFQVNHALCDTLTRRAGYQHDQVDVELPQRRLASFAADRKLPLIDLLPELRVCGQPAYERHASTWSDAGHRAAATAIGGWLEGRYGGQLGVSTRLTSAQ